MKKLMFTTAILLLCISCAVTKQEKLGYSADKENHNQTVQATQAGTHKESGENKNTASASASASVQKTTDSDYNPFRYSEEWKNREEQVAIETYQEFLVKECDTMLLHSFMEDYNTTNDFRSLYAINGLGNCPEVIDYIINIINTSSDKEARKYAIGMLGFRRCYDAIPFLLNHAKKDILPDEKIAIAVTLNILDEKTEAFNMFNCNCYLIDNMDYYCVKYYIDLSDRSISLKYFDYYLNKPHTQIEAASYLAKLGFCDKVFPVFAEFLKNNTAYQRETEIALLGLATIWTEEAFELIRIQTQSKNEKIAKRAQEIYESYYLKRKGK